MTIHPTLSRSGPRHTLVETMRVLFTVGYTAFGGSAANIAFMREQVVTRRAWFTEQQFMDMVGSAMITPGPTATKVSMLIGQRRAGLPGMILGGIAFMLPKLLLMLLFAWAYVRYGTTPAADWLLYGIKPVIIPLILAALWNLGQSAIKNRLTAVVCAATFALTFTNINLVVLLAMGAASTWAIEGRIWRRSWRPFQAAFLPLPLIGASLPTLATTTGLLAIFLAFLKVGSILYGSGYVLFAFLYEELVQTRGWLTEQQLVDAIALGQMMPGPLATSATFIGYLLRGLPGAALATVGIYLPSFAIIAVSGPWIGRIRETAWASSLLDGVNAAALGLMAGVTWALAGTALVDAYSVALAVVGGALVARRINGPLLVIVGAGLGLLSALI